MVMKTCPICKGTGYIQTGSLHHEGGQVVKVDLAGVRKAFNEGKSCRQVAKLFGISAETARVIRNGSWAGYRIPS